ncbi:MAG: hypothetical protein Tsb005_06340 [Gammaproteobacteria bacterium]
MPFVSESIDYSQNHLKKQIKAYLLLQAENSQLPLLEKAVLIGLRAKLKTGIESLERQIDKGIACIPAYAQAHVQALKQLLEREGELDSLASSTTQVECYLAHVDQLLQCLEMHKASMSEAVTYLTASKTQMGDIDAVKRDINSRRSVAEKMSDGYCYGFTLLWMYLIAYSNDGTDDVYYKWMEVISTWDRKTLSLAITQGFEKVFATIAWLQAHPELMSEHKQRNFTYLIDAIVPSTANLPIFHIDGDNENPGRFAGVLSYAEIVDILQQYVKLHRPVYLSNCGHAMAIFRIKPDALLFFNSNNKARIEPIAGIGELVKEFIGQNYKISFHEKSTTRYFPVSVSSFRKPTQARENYPRIAEVVNTLLKNDAGYFTRISYEAEVTPLVFAVREGMPEVTACYLQRGADPTLNDSLFKLRSHPEPRPLMKLLIKQDSDLIQAKNQVGTLHVYAATASLATLTYLWKSYKKQGISINLLTSDNRTVLFYACLNKEAVEKVRYLLDEGADMTITNSDGHSVLMLAIDNQDIAITRVLLKYWLEQKRLRKKTRYSLEDFINYKSKQDETALTFAALHGPKSVFDELRQLGADSHVVPKNKQNLIHLACQGQQTAILRQLLTEPAQLARINDVDTLGNTALHYAAHNGDIYSLELLLPHVSPDLIHIMNEKKYTPLAVAGLAGHARAFDYLMKKGAKLFGKQQPAWKEHPLYIAINKNSESLLANLLTYPINLHLGLELNEVSSSAIQCDVIHVACKKGNYNIVAMLIKRDPTLVNKLDSNGESPLFWAIRHKHYEIIELLLNFGANVNVRSKKEGIKSTPLHWAVIEQDIKLFNIFFKLRKDQLDIDIPNYGNEMLETPYLYALNNNVVLAGYLGSIKFAQRHPRKYQQYVNIIKNAQAVSKTAQIIALMQDHAYPSGGMFWGGHWLRQHTEWSKAIVAELEGNPNKIWSDKDLEELLLKKLVKANTEGEQDFMLRIQFAMGEIITGNTLQHIQQTQMSKHNEPNESDDSTLNTVLRA